VKAALLYNINEDLVLEDIDVAMPIRRDEVLVRTVACGVCHSDRTIQTPGRWPLSNPVVLGHEAAGVVDQVGEDVTDFKRGDHVTLCGTPSCGTCNWCMRGAPEHCSNKNAVRADGSPRLTHGGDTVEPFFGLGGYAEYMLVHHRTLAKLPESMPLDRAALLGCAVMTGLGAVRHAAKVQLGDTVAVIGCGGVGLNVIQGALMAGASRIIAVDRLQAKLEMAKTFGASDTIDASAVDSVEAVLELTGGGVQHAFEVVGIQTTIEQAFGMLERKGTATIVGAAPPSVEVRLKAAELVIPEKRLQGCLMGSSFFRLDIPLYAQLYMDGRLKLDELISERVPLEGINAALKQLDEPVVARAVVTF
jgi:S-(hydroxymethyl)glutathione dehydrogenase / alcohol dehydrogenase